MTEKHEIVRMERTVGPMAAVMVIVGAIIGSGIYISPTGIVENTETPGLSMILWLVAGVVAAMGALCYAEVGLLIPKSGGEYPIIKDSYGDYCGFIFAWVSSNVRLNVLLEHPNIQTCTTIIRPTSFAIFCVTFSKYTYSIMGTCEFRVQQKSNVLNIFYTSVIETHKSRVNSVSSPQSGRKKSWPFVPFGWLFLSIVPRFRLRNC